MSISVKWSLVSCESLDPNSEKIEGFYKDENFINDIKPLSFIPQVHKTKWSK